MEKVAKLKKADIHRNLNLLSSYKHWDGLQMEETNPELENALFDSNLNALIGLVHDTINLGFHISDVTVPEKLRILRKRIIW